MASESIVPPWSAQGVAALVRQAIVERSIGEALDPKRLSFRQAASVLVAFDPTELRPLTGEPERHEALRHLVEDAVVIDSTPERSLWQLRGAVRVEALNSLGSRARMVEALQANAQRPDTVEQRALEACIRGEARPLAKQDQAELAATLQAVRWLAPTLDGLPDIAAVEREHARRQLFGTFERLAGEHFAGRKPELALLRRFVGIDEKRSAPPTGPLVIWGTPGVGKSTLLARFVLDHCSPGVDNPLPFVYLDFDDPRLVIDKPLTLLIEAVRQLGIQFPDQADAYAHAEGRMEEELRSEHESTAGTRLRSDATLPTQVADVDLQRRSREPRQIEQFSALLYSSMVASGSRSEEPRLLLLLDTFEEVQYRSTAKVERLWTWLSELQRAVPQVRTIVSGRAPVTVGRAAGRATDRELGDFDLEAAIGFLMMRGVTDKADARALAEQLGGNPLSLSLGAAVVALEGDDTVGRRGLRWLRRGLRLFPVRQRKLQGVLYKRILGHIHEPAIRELAHPGLVLRRVTPEIIQEVLAGPCHVEVPDRARAEELFTELGREMSLVRVAPDGSLHHRADVRRMMLGEITMESRSRATAIHEAAVRYYSGFDDDVSRAEEIYHRLQLGGPWVSGADTRWTPGVAEHLAGALAELPPAGQVFLARRLEIELSPEVVSQASLEESERYRAARALEELADGAADRALAQVMQGPRSVNSPLNLIEVYARVTLGHHDALRHQLLPELMRDAEAAGDVMTQLRLLVVAAHIAANEGAAVADEALDEAAQRAELLNEAFTSLAVAVARLRLRRLHPDAFAREPGAARTRILTTATSAFERVPLGRIEFDRQMAWSVACELGADHPALMAEVLNAAGLPDHSGPVLARLGEALDGTGEEELELLRGGVGRSWAAMLPETTRAAEFLGRAALASPSASRQIAAFLDPYAEEWSLYLSTFAAYMEEAAPQREVYWMS